MPPPQDKIKYQKEKREGCNAGTPAAWGAAVAEMLRMRTNDIRPLQPQDSNRQHVQVNARINSTLTNRFNTLKSNKFVADIKCLFQYFVNCSRPQLSLLITPLVYIFMHSNIVLSSLWAFRHVHAALPKCEGTIL